MPYESSSWVFRAADRVTESVNHVIDSEHTPPIRLAALGALVGFAVAAAGIEAGRTLMESARGNEQYYVEDRG